MTADAWLTEAIDASPTDVVKDLDPSKTMAADVSMAETKEAIPAWKKWLERCEASDCQKAATMQCPECPKHGIPPTYFCSQQCFKKEWKVHKKQYHAAAAKHKPFRFNFRSSLRPHFVTPMRKVPDTILKPDYWATGDPVSERMARATYAVPIHTKQQIKAIRAACRLGREVLDMAHSMVQPGITTEEIDRAVHNMCVGRGAYPSPLNYFDFPKSCCTSPNDVICHGIPDCRKLEEGDIVNIDISVNLDGYNADLNETYCVGRVEQKYKDLIKCAHDSMMDAISKCKPNELIRDIGNNIQRFVKKHNMSTVRRYCGHGIGENFHALPDIPHYANSKAIGTMKAGMIFTIEPMINLGDWRDDTWPDDWTSVTTDGMRSAQFEHQILITESGYEILTARLPTSPPLWWEEEHLTSSSDPLPASSTSSAAAQETSGNAADVSSAKAKKTKKKKKKKNVDGEDGGKCQGADDSQEQA